MEIADLNLIGDFEAGIKCLQNPSLLSKLSLISKIPQLYSFWTWGALIITLFATFSNVFNRIKMLIHHIRVKFWVSSQNSCSRQTVDQDDFDFDFSDGDGDTPSSAEESDDGAFDSEEDRSNDVFRVDGDGDLTLRRRNGFSWSDFAAGKSVVQLWDSFGLGLDFDNDEFEIGSEIAIWDLDRDVKISSGRRRPAAAAVAENVVLTAEMNGNDGGVGFGTYDSRVDETSPAMYATWRPRRRKIWSDGGVSA